MDNSKKTVANVIYGVAIFFLLTSIVTLFFTLILPKPIQGGAILDPTYYRSNQFVFAIVTLLVSIPAFVLTAVAFFSKSKAVGVGIAAIVLQGLVFLLTFIFTLVLIRRGYQINAAINNAQVALYLQIAITTGVIFIIDLCFNKTWKAKHNEAEKFEQY